jgi:hypothetical protein
MNENEDLDNDELDELDEAEAEVAEIDAEIVCHACGYGSDDAYDFCLNGHWECPQCGDMG